MGLYFVKTPTYLKRIFSAVHWDVRKDFSAEQGGAISAPSSPALYLTFDDGPTPQTTEFVLDTLKSAGAKGSFFCIGKQVAANPGIFARIKDEGHSIGNHTWTHMKGWQNKDDAYLADIARCAEVVDSQLFRPPYGQIKISQINKLKANYRIVMWDVIGGDFDPKVSKEECLKNVVENGTAGSIVVLHDSAKCADKIRFVLPKVLDHFGNKGYQFPALEAAHFNQ